MINILHLKNASIGVAHQQFKIYLVVQACGCWVLKSVTMISMLSA